MKWHDLAKWVIIIAFCVVGVWLLAGCSDKYLRERGDIATDLHKYCLNNPKDSACQGPNSK